MRRQSNTDTRHGLHLDKRGAWLAGVCAGLARHWRADPALVRIGVVVTGLFLTKITIAAYLVAWFLLDED